MNLELHDKVALVTGASKGIGRAVALALAAEGARVAVVARDAGLLDKVAAECRDRSHRDAAAVAADLSKLEEIERTVREVKERLGRVDILVNNAGGVCEQVGRPLEEVRDDEWREIVDANLTSTFVCTRAVVPGMKKAGYGRIVNISSGAGRSVSLTGIQAYASAKAGQIGFTRQTAHELGRFGITVNCIAPGFVLSNPTTVRQWESYGSEGQQGLIDRIATRRLGTPEDIANGVLFFVAEESSWVTGQVLSIDGGHSIF
jgi:3-oxoacyl-[acyl-carrier protein] reductase